MIAAHTPEQVAETYLAGLGLKDPVRWLKRRLTTGHIPGKRLSRNVWVMTDRHIEAWLNTPTPVPVKAPRVVPDDAPLAAGLSARSAKRRRLEAAAC